jgi:hypothetical protein
LVLLVAVAGIGFRPFFLQALRFDRDVAKRQYDTLPYRRLPGLLEISDDVRLQVPRGATMAFRTPYPRWWEGYSFAYMRASYLLAEYRLVPLVDSRDQPRPEVLTSVEWVLAFGDRSEIAGFEVVAAEGETLLLRRSR